MKLLYEKDNEQQLSALLNFYWANFLRCTIFCAVPLAVFFLFSLKIDAVFFPLIIILLFFMPIFILKHTSLLKYETFKVVWTAPVPKSIFSKVFLYPALTYNFLSFLMAFDLRSLFLTFLFEIFLLHIFILNNWLPFQLVPLNPQDAPEKPE